MKLKDFDFRIWNDTKKEYLYEYPTLVNTRSEGILIGRFERQFSRDYDYFYQIFRNEFEIELWTGLYDKDGNKIYENDIIIAHHSGQKVQGLVKFGSGFVLMSSVSEDRELAYYDTFEIIGNIHENKELLNEIA